MKPYLAVPAGAALVIGASFVSLPLRAAQSPPAPGTIITFAGNGKNAFSGDGGPATQAAVGTALHLAFDAAGNLYIASSGDIERVRRVSPAGIIATVAGSGSADYSGDGGLAIKAGMHPVAVAVDRDNTLYISDITHNRVRKVSAGGIITTFAGNGIPSDGAGDGGPGTSARVSPGGMVVDASGNLYFSDNGLRVRMVTPAGIISTVAGTGQAGFSGDGGPATAAQLNGSRGLAVDNAGRLFIADFHNHRIRMVSPDGAISTVAGGGNPADGLGDGGPATEARLDTPTAVALDGAGNLFIADNRSRRIRRVGPVGIISTVAGTGQAGFAGDGGPATQAQLSGPYGLAIDQAGNLFVSDRGTIAADGSDIEGASNERIREVVGVGVPR